MSIVTGPVNSTVAAANRNFIEAASDITLPAGEIQLDAALVPNNNQIINGNGATIINQYTADQRTLFGVGGGLGYFDSGTVTGPNQFTLDPAFADQISNYIRPMPVYLWRLDAFMIGERQLRTLHGVDSINGPSINLTPGGPALDSRITASKWFTRAASVGNVKIGTRQFSVPSGLYTPGDYVLLTQGHPDAAPTLVERRPCLPGEHPAV